jgi:biotin transport system substrate-specific component
MNTTQTTTVSKPFFQTKDLVMIALFTAITCILAPMSVPIPISPVPISLTNLVLNFSIYFLGWKFATVSYLVYLLLGLVGLPVFSGFSGGVAKLAGPTGGYLIGFIFLTIIAGLFVEKSGGKVLPSAIGMILGLAVCYLFGTVWLAYQMNLTFMQGLFAGVIPYLPADIVKIILTLIFAPQIRKRVKMSL